MLRTLLPLLVSFGAGGCELAGDVFQAGFLVGIGVVLVLLASAAWLIRRIRR